MVDRTVDQKVRAGESWWVKLGGAEPREVKVLFLFERTVELADRRGLSLGYWPWSEIEFVEKFA